jgi:hypothetical protein
MKNRSTKTKFILASIYFLVSLFGLVFLYREINNVRQSSDQKLTEWRTEAARRNEIKSLDSLVKKIEDKKAQLGTHFAQSSNPVPFLDTLEKLATSVQAKNTVSSVDVSKDGKFLFVGMNASGSFESFYKFLTLLENSSYNLEFISIDMKQVDENTRRGDWSATIKIKLLTFIK